MIKFITPYFIMLYALYATKFQSYQILAMNRLSR